MNKYIKFFVGFIFFSALLYAAEHRQPVIFDTDNNTVVEPTNFVNWVGTAAGGNATNAQPPATILTNLVNNIGPTTNGVVTYVGNSNFITRRVLPGYGILVTNTGFTNDITIAIDPTVAGGSGTNGQPANTGLTNITRVVSPGILVVTATNTYTTRSISSGTANITVTSGSGVAGNPIINFVPNGSANEIQYNAGASALGSSANFTFDPAGPLLTENGDATINGTITAQTLNESVGGNLANSWGYDLRATNALNGKYLNVTNSGRIPTLTNDNLTINSNFNVLSVSTTLGVIDWNVARQEATLGVNTNFTFANVKAGNEVRLVVKQNAIGGYSVTVPTTVVYFNSTNQTSTLSVNTNANATTALYFFIANGVTNVAMSGADAPVMSEIANANYTTNGQIFMVTNGGIQLVDFPYFQDPSDNTRVSEVEEFYSQPIFSSTIPSIGKLGWTIVASVSASSQVFPTNLFILNGGHPGIYTLWTTTNKFGYALACLGDGGPAMNNTLLSFPLGLMTNWEATFDFRVDSTNFIKAYAGFVAAGASPDTRPAHGIYMQYDTVGGDTNWVYTAAQASAFTAKGTGVQSTNWMHLRTFCNTSNNIVYQANYGAFYTNTVNNPTNFLTPYFAIENVAIGGPNNTNANMFIDRWSFKAIIPQR